MTPEKSPPPPPRKGIAGFIADMRNVGRMRKEVWKMVSAKRRRTLITAASLMAVTAMANVAVPLWLGGLVDAMRGIEPADFPARLPRLIGESLGIVGDYPWHRQTSGIQPLGEILPTGLMTGVAVSFLLCIALAFIAREGLKVLQRYLVQNTCTQIEKEITVSLVDHLMRVDLNRLSSQRIGALHGRIHRSVEGFVKFLKLGFMDFFPAIFMAGIALAAAVSKQWWLGIAMAGVIPASFFIILKQIGSQKGVRVSLLRKKEALDGTVVEQLGGIEYIRAANTRELELRRVESVAEDRRTQELKHHMTMGWFDCFKALNEGFFHIAIITLAIYLAVRGSISVGDIIVFSSLFLSVMHPLREIHRILDDAHESSIQVADLMGLQALPVDASYNLLTLHEPEVKDGKPVIVVENLTVEYTTADGRKRQALHDVSMVVRHGETIGVAGPSGSGKSTWLKVVMRLIHPTNGEVFLGGEPVSAISRETIARLIGYASQTPFIFSGTIAENIAYGTPGVTEEKIREAAERACIHDEIMQMPGGYSATVSERGQNLSGGQRQRIAIARIFLKNPPVLVLDEGTAALDNISERKVQEALTASRADRTTIIVAHRLSTLRDSNRIFVFADGRIVETGSYDELLQKGGVFTELVRSAEGGHE
ncbi:MAG TPA: ABC transporter ATP-binding protein [Verrucomicrobiales bacterium]|nr:ABC transporter ATP-binding protein [Verrucomicrobiales bacterium]